MILLERIKKVFLKIPKSVLIGVFVFVVATAPFVGNMNDSFVSDDWDMLYANTHFGTPWQEYFFTNQLGESSGGSYRPIASLYWRAGYVLFGLNPLGMHLGNILLHGLSSVLVFVLSGMLFSKKPRRLLIGAAAGLFFAVLPNRAEPVIWVSAPDVLAVFFFLLSLVLFLKSLSKPRWCIWFLRSFSLIFAAASIFTKEIALTIPAVIFLSSLFFGEENKVTTKTKSSLVNSLPYILVVAFYFFARYRVLGLFLNYYGPDSRLDLPGVIQSAVDLTISHLFSGQLQMFLRGPLVFLGIFAVGLLVSVFFLVQKRFRKDFLFLAVVYLVTIVPVIKLSISYIPDFIGSEGERYAYLPSVFFSILLACLISRLQKIRVAVVAILILICLFVAQLLPKTILWQQASWLAEQSLVEVSNILNQGQYDGVLIVGLPDQVNGAVVFRNVFDRALSFYRVDNTVVFGIFNHVYHDQGESYSLIKLDDYNFSFESESDKKLLAAPESFSSADYDLELEDREFVKFNNDHWLGSVLNINFPERLLKENRIAIIFFDGEGWQEIGVSQY